MAWDFDGVDNYVKFAMPAALQVAAGGPMTMAALINLDNTTDGALIHTMSGSTSFQFLEVFSTYNYGTTAGTRTGPSAAAAVGAWYYVIISKGTGNVAPEYTLIPLAAPTSPVSGTITGGGATLGDGTAPGASGFIQAGRWGTSSTEYINGRIAATAIWNAYLNQAAREALVTWALTLASSGIQWAVRYDALTSRTDTIGGGNETARFGTAPITLVSDPSGAFFGGTGPAPAGLAVPVALGTPTVALGLTTTPTGIAVPAAPGTPTAALNRSAAPTGITATAAVGTPATAIPAAAPAGVAAAAAPGTPTVALGRTAAPGGIAVPAALGTPNVSSSPAPVGIALAVALGTPTVALNRAAAPTSIAVAAAVGPASSAYTLAAAPVGIAVPVALGSPGGAFDPVPGVLVASGTSTTLTAAGAPASTLTAGGTAATLIASGTP